MKDDASENPSGDSVGQNFPQSAESESERTTSRRETGGVPIKPREKASLALTLQDLLDLAREAAKETEVGDACDEYENQSYTARVFLTEIGTHIERAYGSDAADEFYTVLGYGHLLPRNKNSTAPGANGVDPAAGASGGTATRGGDSDIALVNDDGLPWVFKEDAEIERAAHHGEELPVDVLWCDSCGRPNHLHVRTETAGLLCPYPFSGSFRPLSKAGAR